MDMSQAKGIVIIKDMICQDDHKNWKFLYG
jgi:hypothetical protein